MRFEPPRDDFRVGRLPGSVASIAVVVLRLPAARFRFLAFALVTISFGDSRLSSGALIFFREADARFTFDARFFFAAILRA
jgi:hypothetical protein